MQTDIQHFFCFFYKFLFKNKLTISISECIPEFKKLMPPVISIGILF